MAFCPSCGSKLDDGTKFCPSCGAAQTENANTYTYTNNTNMRGVVHINI
jgi:uncharacterized membrane protein YvbJ